MLNYLNNKFNNSSLKTKIELYLLPLLIIYLLYYILSNMPENQIKEIKKTTNINSYINKKFDASFLDLFNKIETIAKQLNIKVQSLNNIENSVELRVYAKIKDIGKLIKKIEAINNFTKITSISIYKKDELDRYLIDFIVDLNSFYLKNINDSDEEKYKKSEKTTAKEKQKKIENKKEDSIKISNNKKEEYKLTAIVSDFVMINDKWIKKGERIDDLKLVKVSKNFIILQNHKNKFKLELINEEYYKNIY